MKIARITAWLDRVLEPGKFHDVSLNGLQLGDPDGEVKKVAFAVDGSVRSVMSAAEAGAGLLVVHHGILWRGHVRPLPEGARNVRDAASAAGVALYASHLPLDANRRYGNNWELARYFGLKRIRPAFSYHGNVIGVTGVNGHGRTIGVCSGGAGGFATEAKALGCDMYVTGEADWGEVITAENIGMEMICAGHYETETFGVKALMKAMKKALKISTVFVSLMMCLALNAQSVDEEEVRSSPYLGLSGSLVLPQGGSRLARLGGAALLGGCYFNDWFALEGEAAWMENRAELAARGVAHWKGWNEWDMLFGFSRWDPFFTLGAKGWLKDGQVGPAAGVGFLYYLDDNWALRAEAEATLGLESRREMVYSAGVGIQYGW